MNKIEAFTSEQLKAEVPAFNIGDTVRIANKIKEGSRERIQMFEGVVIARRNGGISETFTSAASPTAAASRRPSRSILRTSSAWK